MPLRPPLRPSHHARRGLAYGVVLVTAALVCVMGLSALMGVRVRMAAAEDSSAALLARHAAQAALELGVQMVYEDPNWRGRRIQGKWLTNVPIGAATLELEASDPVDGDFADSPLDPLRLIGRGAAGRARQALEVTINTSGGLGCLETALHSHDRITLTSATVNGTHVISSNFKVDATTSQVYPDVDAGDKVSGATFHGRTRDYVPQRSMPDPAGVFTYYLSRGTTILYSDLPSDGPNLLTNPGFEGGGAGWSAIGGGTTLNLDNVARSGSFSMRVTGRSAATDGPVQDVTSLIQNNTAYHVEAWVRNYTSNIPTMRVCLEVGTRSSPVSPVSRVTYTGPGVSVGSAWVKLTGDFNMYWTGSLVEARLFFRTDSSTLPYRVDDVSLAVTGLSGRRISREVLSPQRNPFGNNVNAEGIYVIDCGGQQLIIEDSRIVGTLVLRNPGANTTVQGTVNWEAAVPNFPILLTNGPIEIVVSGASLSESTLMRNFNPTGTPYPYVGGGSDSDEIDAYPAVLRGLIYVGGDATIRGAPTIEGALVATGRTNINTATLALQYRPLYIYTPPPGFDATSRTIEVLRNSFVPVTQ